MSRYNIYVSKYIRDYSLTIQKIMTKLGRYIYFYNTYDFYVRYKYDCKSGLCFYQQHYYFL